MHIYNTIRAILVCFCVILSLLANTLAIFVFVVEFANMVIAHLFQPVVLHHHHLSRLARKSFVVLHFASHMRAAALLNLTISCLRHAACFATVSRFSYDCSAAGLNAWATCFTTQTPLFPASGCFDTVHRARNTPTTLHTLFQSSTGASMLRWFQHTPDAPLVALAATSMRARCENAPITCGAVHRTSLSIALLHMHKDWAVVTTMLCMTHDRSRTRLHSSATCCITLRESAPFRCLAVHRTFETGARPIRL